MYLLLNQLTPVLQSLCLMAYYRRDCTRRRATYLAAVCLRKTATVPLEWLEPNMAKDVNIIHLYNSMHMQLLTCLATERGALT